MADKEPVQKINPELLQQQRKDLRQSNLDKYLANRPNLNNSPTITNKPISDPPFPTENFSIDQRDIKTDTRSAFETEFKPKPVVASGRKFGYIAQPPLREKK